MYKNQLYFFMYGAHRNRQQISKFWRHRSHADDKELCNINSENAFNFTPNFWSESYKLKKLKKNECEPFISKPIEDHPCED